QHEGLGGESDGLTGCTPVADRTTQCAVDVFEQTQDLALHEHLNVHGDGPLLQGADQLQSGAVAYMGQTGVAVAPEVALKDAAVWGAIEERAPALQLVDAVRRLLRVKLS